jgi:outer membrane receptor protein involved in Fe transport
MKSFRFLSATALAGVVLATAITPTYAQTAATPAADTGGEDAIIVTGSRIRNSNLESQAPVTVLVASDLTNAGAVSLGDQLNDLPALRSTYSTANSTRFIGTTGLSLLDLRGLGISRTLVLQNGRRQVSASEGENLVDVNSIPTDLVDRVEVVTGGTSAIYGSDAIAGVVNFILKDKFEGLTARAQAGISSKGDRPSQFVSLTGGMNFADGRGNIAANVEFAHNGQLSIRDRDYTKVRLQFQQVEFDPAGTNSDGQPDRLFFTDVRSLLLSQGGTFVPTVSTANPLTFIARTNPDGSVVRVARVYRFNSDGTIREADYGTRDFRFGLNSDGSFNAAGGTNTLGGDGETLRDYGQLQPEIRRYSANLLGHLEISNAFIPYFETKYVRVESFQESSPTFGQGGTNRGALTGATFASNSTGIPIRFDNPYLTTQASTFLRSITTAGDAYFRINRNNVDLGSRGEDGLRQTYRGVLGVKGTFNDDWSYDLSLNYGKVQNRIFALNNRIQQRFELAVDATRDPANGQIICRSKLVAPALLPTVDANGRPIPANIAKNAQLTNDIAQCVPINVLGAGSPSQAAKSYINQNTRYDGRQTQFDILGFVSGDLSQLFELPGGPIGFAFGGEYRRETASYTYGPVTGSGLTFLNAIPDFVPPALDVKEVFGEVNIPLLKDTPGFYELTVKAAGRYSSYNNATGRVFAWNAGVVYSPFRGLRFRGNYSVAVRAPTLGDLYSSPTQNFANITDPCDVQQINSGSATRAANCAAAGVPAGFINLPARSQSTELLSSGNSSLREERSRSLTIGGILQPEQIPGLAISVDYYRIAISNVIESVTAQNTVNLCYDAPTLTNAFCPNVLRDATTKLFLRPGVLTKSFNYAKRISEGVDVDVSYTGDLGPGKLTTRLIGTWTKRRDNFPVITDPTFRDQILNELGDPEYAYNVSADYKIGGFTLGYQFRFLDKMYVNTIEDIITINGAPPQNPDYSSPLFYPAVTYHDIRASYDVNTKFQIYGGIDNALDKEPPFGLTGTGAGSGIYDNVGRFFYVGIKASM